MSLFNSDQVFYLRRCLIFFTKYLKIGVVFFFGKFLSDYLFGNNFPKV